MCGFFAAIGPGDRMPVDTRISQALEALKARGPDGEGQYRVSMGATEAVFGHRRLALVGLDNGRQPLVSGRTVAVVNGEFYGQGAIRASLIGMGIDFDTASDSELVPRLYQAFGGEEREGGGPGRWIDPLTGEFAFVMLDRETEVIWAACDPFGAKPLVYWMPEDRKSLMLASDIKTLIELGAPRVLDEHSLRFALELQYLPFGRTLFKDIHMLPPGSWLKWRSGELALGTLWNVATMRPTSTAFSGAHWEGFGLSARTIDAVERALHAGADRSDQVRALRGLIIEAAARRLPGETSFATHLSGGIDSAAASAITKRLSGNHVDSFCASFPWAADGDETAAAAESARLIGVEFHPVVMSPENLLRAMDEAAYRSEGLSINLHAGAKILIAEAVRERGHRCVFTGEGADEAFFGYEHFRWDFPSYVAPPAGPDNPATSGIQRPDGSEAAIPGLSNLLNGLPTWIRTKAGAAAALRPAFGERLRSEGFVPERLVTDLPPELRSRMQDVSSVERARALWSIYCLSGYILRGLDDAMGMSRGVESRLMFLDPAVQWFAARLSPSVHFRIDGLEKGLMREALSGLVPDAVLTRPKRPFLAPSVLGSDVGQSWARDRLLGGGLVRSGLFTEAGLTNLLDQPSRPVRDAGVLTLASVANLMNAFDLA